jgi:hypothetical protein
MINKHHISNEVNAYCCLNKYNGRRALCRVGVAACGGAAVSAAGGVGIGIGIGVGVGGTHRYRVHILLESYFSIPKRFRSLIYALLDS